MTHNGGGMASKGLRVISCQVIRDVGAGYNPAHTSETLICYTECYEHVLFFVYHLFPFINTVKIHSVRIVADYSNAISRPCQSNIKLGTACWC